jgi:hypothetical protein
MTDIDDLFRKAHGKQIPGGCEDCDAYQTMDEVRPRVHMLTVHHDDDCPTLRAMKADEN